MDKPKANRRADHTAGHRAAFDRNRLKLIRTGKASGAVCAICGGEIDFDRKYPDPMSVSVDHIIPISRGGHPSDIDNLQLVHMRCNIAKSNKISAKDGENEQKMSENDAKKEISMRDLPQSCDWVKYRCKA